MTRRETLLTPIRRQPFVAAMEGASKPSSTLELTGPLTRETAVERAQVLRARTQALVAGSELCLDLQGVTAIDGCGLQLLASTRAWAGAHKVSFSIRAVSKELRSVPSVQAATRILDGPSA
jgi:ABC-type transporter Mla MlaB component